MTKWILTIEDDEGQRTSLDLDLEEYTVGRGEDRDVRLTERNISRQHALLRRNEEGWKLFDEGSYNGSFVNGARVGSDGIAVQAGDVANLGDYRIEIADATEQQAVEEPARQRRPDRLICVIGPVPGSEFALEGDRLSIGRAEEAYVTINHASVSRLHAELHNLGEGRWEVVDQGSANGVRINGVELRRGIIEPGDALELGDVRLRFVAAGKFFRPALDIGSELPAMPLDGMTAAAGSRPGSSRLMAVGAIVVLALVLGGGYALFAGGETVNAGDPAAPIAATDEQAQAYLDQAIQSTADGDIHAAHRILQKIPESSPLREGDVYGDIEDQWAEAMFDKAEETKDPEEKVRIYNRISETTTVSADKRKKALDLAAAIPTSETPNLPYRPKAPMPATGWPTGDTPATTAKPGTSSASKSSPPSTTATGKFNEKSEKQRLLGKAMSGTASETELRMLKAICMNDGDRVCRDMATARLKALRDKK